MALDRPRKKVRLSPDQPQTGKSAIWQPFRALAIITNEVPFVVQSLSSKHLRKPEFTFTTCTGTAFAVWAEEAMRLKFVGQDADFPISSLAATSNNRILAAAGPFVIIYERGKKVGRLDQPNGGDGTLTEILMLGDHLHALSKDGQQLIIWTISSQEHYTTISFPSNFTASRMIHPDTYLNKVVVASVQGELAIWNTQTGTCIHTFEKEDLQPSGGSIQSLAQSPAVDVLAIGYESGVTIIFDIRQGQLLFSVKMDLIPPKNIPLANSPSRGITSISFRTDNVAHTLATASSDGNIAIWDLDTGIDASLQPGRLLHVLRLAHLAPVSRIHFLPGQPILVSSAGDNALKQWLFDSPTGPPRILRERSGHAGPPTLIRHFGSDGKQLLTAGGSDDRTLRLTSLVRDSRSAEIAQTHSHNGKYGVESRLPPISSLSWNAARSKEWDDLVTVHVGEDVARTWSVQNKRQGNFTLDSTFVKTRDDKGKKYKRALGTAKAVCISSCGNFAFVGHASSAGIGMWNMQSGVQRKTFNLPGISHTTGIATDALNKLVVVSTLDGRLHFFDFHTTKHSGSIQLTAGSKQLILNRDNNLMALNCEDAVVRIVDIETRRVVREISSGNYQILDVAFSHDSRWLVTASQDRFIRTFDLPTGNIMDAFRTPTVAVSITFSPTGDFLATAHLNNIGIYLWTNTAQFTEISFKSFASGSKNNALLSLPGMRGDDDEVDSDEDGPGEIVPNGILDPRKQIMDDDLTSLSLQPRSKWQTLLNLDAIRLRNKPSEPPKAPEQAPFFLPTVAGLEHQFDSSAPDAQKERKGLGQSDLLQPEVSSAVLQVLKDGQEDNFAQFFAMLVDLPTSSLDVELRSISPNLLSLFVDAMTARLQSHRDFEAVQAILAVFLRVQADAIVQDETLQSALLSLLEQQRKESARVNQLIGFCQGTLAFVRNVPIV